MTSYSTIKEIGRFLAIFAVAFSFVSTGIAAESTVKRNSIESVDHATLPGGKIVVKIKLSQELKQAPKAFTTSTPPRISLDFIDTDNGLPMRTVDIGGGLLRNMSALQANNRTRIVFNLSAASTYDIAVDGKVVLVTVQRTGTASVKDSQTSQFGQAAVEGEKNTIRKVDFQRGQNGEGRVIVDLDDVSSKIDIRQQGKNLVVDFLNSDLVESMERRLNVVNFATPVILVDTFKQGTNARMLIEPKGEWEYSAYQSDNRFTVEVRPVVFDSSKLVQGTKAAFGGEKLSMDFNGIDIKNLLRVIADFTGKNVVVSDSVQGTITLSLKNVPWDQALDIIMKQKDLGMENLGNTLVFAPSAEIAARKKQLRDQENQLDSVKPLVTQSYAIKYQKAYDIKALISDPKQPLLSRRGSSVVDPVTNTLFVRDIDTSLTKIQDILNQIDIPARQVLIEARIVNADESFSKSLGTRFGVVRNRFLGSSTYRNDDYMLGSTLASSYSINQTGETTTPTDLNVNLPATSATGATPASIAFSLFRLPAGFLLNLELSAAEADGKTKVISSPRVITANQKEATFDYGEEIPYQQSTSSGATSVSFKKATLGIKVVPQITHDDKISMDIEVTNDSRGRDTTAGPAINTNKVSTKALVDNGETAVLGGFFRETTKNSNERVPFFGSLPVVGSVFRSNSRENARQEILFFITPKIMSDSLILN